MAVYSKKASKKQKRLMAEYEKVAGFEFTQQDLIDDGSITFNEA